MRALLISIIILCSTLLCYSQEALSGISPNASGSEKFMSGFIRGGLYTWIDNTDDKLYVSSAFSDIGLKLETGNDKIYKAFADLRFRYGSEFLNPVSKFDIREAWVALIGTKWEFVVGQKIIKWGRCDFTNPTSKLSPLNMIFRSPDREDMNMGNLLASASFFPFEKADLEAVIIPWYRSSVLIIDPIPLPDYVVINQLPELITDKNMFSYGFKADFHLRMIDWSLSWFDGYDPMPGMALTLFDLDLSEAIPVPYTELSVKPYRNRVLGADFETAAGAVGLRGEASWSVPELSFRTNEYVPFPDIEWAAGADRAFGKLRITAEYSGKFILDFTPSAVDPLIGTEPDYQALAGMLATPGFDINDYVKQQVGAFNRLYNNQLKETYHSAALRLEAELMYGRLLPSVLTMYNFTSCDMLIIPEIKIKPADGLVISVGAEIYSGPEGSLYDLVDDFMNGVYLSLRVDF